MILYFSATGNTRFIAEELAKRAEAAGIKGTTFPDVPSAYFAAKKNASKEDVIYTLWLLINYRNIRIGFDVLQEVIIGSSYVTLLVDSNSLFLLPDAEPHLPRKIDIPGGEKPGINVVVDRFLAAHQLIPMSDIDLMNRMTLLHKRRDNPVQPGNLFLTG